MKIYKKYFQKSYTFLYPLLGIKRELSINPIQTYLTCKNIDDRCLILRYEYSEECLKFLERYVFINVGYVKHIIKKNNIFVIISLDYFRSEIDGFYNGEYSKISITCKKEILSYYGIHSSEYQVIESYLYPDKYFNDYAIELDVDKKILEQVGELCDKPNKKEEHLNLEL